MKICFAGPADSIHIVKWCRWFTGHGHEVFVISFTKGKIPGVRVYTIQTSARPQGSDFNKIRYLFSGRAFRDIIKKEQPDIINAHYATSYGAAMALSGVKNYILSVWGSDIYDFPKKSPLHQALLKFSLRKASMLFSTSRAMADEAVRYTSKKFEITPFGVDMKLFSPDKRTRPAGSHPFVIGIVKTLDDLYGIDYLIKAVSMIHTQRPELSLSLRISGTGPEAETYRRLAEESGIADFTVFNGHISQAQAAKEWADMDVAVIPSALYESFGVSAVEAQACQTPLIISDVAGLLETTVPGRSSEVVPKKDAAAIARRILELYDDSDRRKRMGEYARAHVLEHYELDHCFNKIETVYLERGGVTADSAYGDLVTVRLEINARQDFVIGTIKGLSDKYGISYLLEAVSRIRTDYPDCPVKLRIAGKGPREQEYQELASRLGIEDITSWLGFISQEQAAVEWADMDVAVIPSVLDSESFGVSAVEAQACGVPVIISDVPGLREAVRPGGSALVVPKRNAVSIAKAVTFLYRYPGLRKTMGENGRNYVLEQYGLDRCFQSVERLFRNKIEKEFRNKKI